MLIKLTEAGTGNRFLVNEDIIRNIFVDDGETVVILNRDIRVTNTCEYSGEFVVEETIEEIYQQQFKTCESSL